MRSVANKIYSFPLNIDPNSSFFSESEDEGLEDVALYDLNSQNHREKKVQWHLPTKKDKFLKKKRYLEDRSNEQKKRIRERSQETKRKYADLLKLVDKSDRPASSLNKGKNSSMKQSSILKSKEPIRSEN